MPLLELSEVHARYGPVRALHGVSLTARRGRDRRAARRERRRQDDDAPRDLGHGRARRARSSSTEKQLPRRAESTARRGITHVPEGRGILGELTVWENLKMGAYLRRDRKAVAQDFDEVTSELPWLARAARPAGRNAVGRRAADARARARAPLAAAAAAPRRALARARADHRRAVLPGRAAGSTRSRACRC